MKCNCNFLNSYCVEAPYPVILGSERGLNFLPTELWLTVDPRLPRPAPWRLSATLSSSECRMSSSSPQLALLIDGFLQEKELLVLILWHNYVPMSLQVLVMLELSLWGMKQCCCFQSYNQFKTDSTLRLIWNVIILLY